ncbi:MAG: exosortase/archaeosortase family protein [Acidobacteriota bacterium]
MLPSAASLTERISGGATDVVKLAAQSRGQRLVLTIAIAELVVLFTPTLAWLFERWTQSVWSNAHGLLIVPVVGYFAYQELRPLSHLPTSASPWGFALLAPALMLHALDAGMHTQLLSAVALLLALPGLSLLLLGTLRTRAILFPLAFLAFALPIPLALTEQFHWQLRLVVTAATATAIPWFGIPVFVEGTTLHMAQGAVEIADACSGFSTLYASAAVASLTAYSASSTGRRLLVLLSAAPLAIAANLLRVIGLVLLVVWHGQDVLDTFLHPLSGMLTFALALPVIFWLGGDLKR